ncbi:MAG: hypothetical protein JW953_24035 [Anaerolineae bacterium]|nr:hypothetical protein [Anaerolineae bacterium]
MIAALRLITAKLIIVDWFYRLMILLTIAGLGVSAYLLWAYTILALFDVSLIGVLYSAYLTYL